MKIDRELPDEKNVSRLHLLIISRLVIITLVLGVAIFIDIRKADYQLSTGTLNFLYIIIAATYFFSVVYILLLKIIPDLKINIYFQLAVDILLITMLVYITGSFRSNYSPLYSLVIICSVIFLGRYGGIITASAASIFYGLLLDFEFYGLIAPLASAEYDYNLNAGYVFVRILVHIVSFYILAFLASFVVEQEKKARFLLQEKESAFDQLDLLFRSIVESVDTGIMTVDLEGSIKTFNRAAEEITGLQWFAVKNRQLANVFPEFVPALLERINKEQAKSRLEIIINRDNEEKIHLGCSISALKNKRDQEIGSIIIFQDLTEIKIMEESLEKGKRLALVGEMAAGLAHEMRNPLASIAGSIELLKQSLDLENTDERLMQIILRGKDQLDCFVRDFLSLARPIPVTRELVHINEIIRDALENIKLSNRPEKIVINNMSGGDVIANANYEQIRQVIHNLALNAIQAMPDGGVLSLDAKLLRHHDRNVVEIKVTDTGCGIEEKYLDEVFKPFFTKKDKGTGLGLTIVGRIVDGYEGRIKIESIVGQGTTCTVWLPSKSA